MPGFGVGKDEHGRLRSYGDYNATMAVIDRMIKANQAQKRRERLVRLVGSNRYGMSELELLKRRIWLAFLYRGHWLDSAQERQAYK